MTDSENTVMEGRPLSPSIHPYMLFATDVNWTAIHTELFIKIVQARGIVGLLTNCEVDGDELPNNAIQQTAWMLDELLEAIGTLADMMEEKLCAKISKLEANEKPGGESMTIIDKNVNLEHYAIFLERLDQARSTVIELAVKDPHHQLDGDIACSLLSAANVVRRRAKDALESVSVESEEVQS